MELSGCKLEQILEKHVLVLDGAMGTMIQRLHISEEEWRGKEFAGHPVKLSGCNDLLSITAPEKISQIHSSYLEAGADIISTNTFNSNAISLSDYGLDTIPGFIRRLNREAAALAVKAAHEAPPRRWGGCPFVAGSVGPTSRAASMSPTVDDPASRNITYDELSVAYEEQIEGLLEGGVDILLFETVFDTLNLKSALDAASRVMARRGVEVPVMVSATVGLKSGRLLSGQTIEAFVTSIEGYDHLLSIGLNCTFPMPKVAELGGCTEKFVSCHPNAGLPNALGEYDETPEKFAAGLEQMLAAGRLNIAGGCCGTTPEHIKALSETVKRVAVSRSGHSLPKALRVSGLERLEILPENNFVNVGERCNVAGSRKFLRLIKEKKYEEAAVIAAKQVADGAMMIDVNMDDALLDARAEMVHFLRYIASEPEIAKVPVMVDSSDWEVVEEALKNLQGKSIVNSISLKEGEEPFIKKAIRIRQLGAAVIVMAFDEQGQADTFERKTEVAHRAYNLLTEKCGFKPEDIIFDVNIMAVATGIEAHNNYGIDFIRAVAWIKENLPGVRTSGGVSNLSFAFRGKNYLREAMHAVFLYHAISAGLDMGIVNPASSVTYDDIPADLRILIEDVVLARRPESADELAAYAASGNVENSSEVSGPERNTGVSVELRLTEAIVKGKTDYLSEDLDEALSKGMAPVDLIEGPLMAGMDKVGQLFGEGKMFLPQVVKTARTMKMAVDHLRPHMTSSRISGKSAGKVVFATVKGDVHDIGKNIVSIVLACNNYEVIDLGVMVPAEEIVEVAKREHPDLICLSGLITPSLSEMVNVARSLREAGLDIPLIVGGATTSRLHTALKIAPAYEGGVVVHATDAAQNPLIAAKLLNPSTKRIYTEEITADYKRLRDEYAASHGRMVPLEKAREEGHRLNRYPLDTVRPLMGIDNLIIIHPTVREVAPFINWKMFFHAWRISGEFIQEFPFDGCEECAARWLSSKSGIEREKAQEAWRLYLDARDILLQLDAEDFRLDAMMRFVEASADGDDLILGRERLPLLRQQREGSDFLCLTDFISKSGEEKDYVGVFVVTAGKSLAEEADLLNSKGDSYGALLRQTIADRLVEAASEYVHGVVRRKIWGYAEEEDLPAEAMLRGDYKGIRPAVGYPMIPDQLLNHTFARIIPFNKLGVTVTENGAMYPTSTISGLYVSNPESRYFMVGTIGEDQLSDYASRRGISQARVREILRM